MIESPDVGLAQIARPRVEQEADELQEGEDTEDVTPSDDSEVEEEAEAALVDSGDDSTDELRTSASNWLETNVLRSTASINNCRKLRC